MGKKTDSKLESIFNKFLYKKHNEQATLQSYIPIEYIKDGVIKIKNHDEYRTIIQVNALNFFNKTPDEVNAIIRQFGIFLNTIKEPIQLICQSKTLNIKDMLNELKDKYLKDTNPYTKEYIAIYGDLLNNLAQNSNVLTKDFYFIVEYSAKEGESLLSVTKTINLMTDRIIKNLKGCLIDSNQLKDNKIYQLLYLFYNKDKSKFQSISDQNIHKYMSTSLSLKKEDDIDRHNFNFMNQPITKPGEYRNINKIDDSFGVLDEGIVTVEDIISADDIINEKDYLIINNRYVRTIFISGILKDDCSNEWLSDIYTYPVNIDVSLHITPIPKKMAIDDLTKKYNIQLSAINEVAQKGKILSEQDKNDAAELQYLRQIISGNQELFYLSFYITLSANDLEELDDLTMDMESMLGSKQILSRRAALSQLNAFNSVLPIGMDNIRYYRNIPTDALATFFPYVNSELSSTKGKPILYGRNLLTGSLIIFDKFNPPDNSITNYNTIICGAAGSGKSFATKLELMRRFIEGTKIIGIDPNSEYRSVAARCGGQYISVDSGSRERVNIFDITFYRDPETNKIPQLLNDKIMNLHSIIRMMYTIANAAYTALDFNTLDKALKDVYAYKGINDDPASLFKDNRIIEGSTNISKNLFKEVPTLSDFKYILINNYGDYGNHIANEVLNNFIDGSYNIFNGQSTIDTSGSMLFFDIKNLHENLRPLVYLVLCEFIWEKIKKKPKRENAMFIVDEAWIMMHYEYTAKFLSDFARQDRKFNVGLSCVTQQAGDFFNDKWGYGKTIYYNSSMNVLMKQNREDIDIIKDTYKISDSIKMDLLTQGAGNGYIFWGNTYTKIYFEASQDEFKIVNTNPNIA